MNVGRRMSRQVITVPPEMSIIHAHELMSREKVHRLPVLKKGKLVGVVSENDILKAYPSAASTLAIWEINELLLKIQVKRVMRKDVFTVTEDTTIEEAARIMVDNKISSLPVMKGDELVGIITETDVFRIMLEMLGARHPGSRITVLMPNQPGQIARVTQAIFEKGHNITSLSTFEGDTSANFMITLKVDDITPQDLKQLIEPLVLEVLSVSS